MIAGCLVSLGRCLSFGAGASAEPDRLDSAQLARNRGATRCVILSQKGRDVHPTAPAIAMVWTRRTWDRTFWWIERFLARIVDAAELGAQDQVLEIGPGLGGLTRAPGRAGPPRGGGRAGQGLVGVLKKRWPICRMWRSGQRRYPQPGRWRVDGRGAPAPTRWSPTCPITSPRRALRHLLETRPRAPPARADGAKRGGPAHRRRAGRDELCWRSACSFMVGRAW